MSSIYIQEPPTLGKVLLKTSVGDIDIELWSKEAPKTCRNFVQLCMEGYYDGTIFHRVIKGFVAQGGDPTGTGTGGQSIYEQTFKNEIHQRLRFVRRGLVATANADQDIGSQFFFTFDAAPELQGKHTIFGKITGDTIYNMLKLEETVVDENERPIYEQKILKAKILSNPFDDIIPRVKKHKADKRESRKRNKGTKNFSLLSFGEEAEEDEEQVDAATNNMRKKSKSSHDLANDPSLSSLPAVEIEHSHNDSQSDHSSDESSKQKPKKQIKSIRDKLVKSKNETKSELELRGDASGDSDGQLPDEREAKRLKQRDDLRAQVEQLKKEIKKSSSKTKIPEVDNTKPAEKDEDSDEEVEESNEMMRTYKEQRQKFRKIKKGQLKKGGDREAQTLKLLSKFKDRLHSEPQGSDSNDQWFANKLDFEDQGPVLAKDANMQNAETFDIFDPRNPINKRRRDGGSKPK